MHISGENFVKLVGKIKYKEFSYYNDYLNFKCKLAIPLGESFQFIKLSACGDIAEALNDLSEDTFIKVLGHIEEVSYDNKCRYCKGPYKSYWTNVVVDNFIVL